MHYDLCTTPPRVLAPQSSESFYHSVRDLSAKPPARQAYDKSNPAPDMIDWSNFDFIDASSWYSGLILNTAS